MDDVARLDTLNAIQADITTLKVDAIVNAANSALAGGGGVDGAIHAAAGPTVLDECQRIIIEQGLCPPGSAVVTGSGNLPAKWIIHTVGPIWDQHGPEESASLLSDCYTSSLDAAANMGATSTAFSAISTGVYGFPKELAAPIAVAAVAGWFQENVDRSTMMAVTLVCFDAYNFHLTQQSISDLDHRE